MKKIRIERSQIWRHKVSGDMVVVHGKHGDKWIIIRVNKQKRNSSDSHTVSNQTLWSKFTLV